jgi:hypothetical protein
MVRMEMLQGMQGMQVWADSFCRNGVCSTF